MQDACIIFGHMHNHDLGFFLSLLNHFLYLCFESSSKLAELDRGGRSEDWPLTIPDRRAAAREEGKMEKAPWQH